MAAVVWSEHARDRVREQAQYILQESCAPDIAMKWADDIFSATETLADFPESGRRLPEFPDSPYRELIVRKNFRVIYRYNEGVCSVITVRRCSMELNESVLQSFDYVTS